MIIFEDPLNNRMDILPGSAVALGFFDGVHIAHEALIKRCVFVARERGLKSVVHTFDYLPKGGGLITDFEERVRLIENLDVDILALERFTPNFMNMEPRDFIGRVLIDSLHAKFVISGYDHTFGRQKGGDAKLLKEVLAAYHVPVEILGEITVAGEAVSSAGIKKLIASGKIENANALLGRNYKISGTVLRGRKVGRTIGIPTANIAIKKELLCPPYGVYVCKASVDGAAAGFAVASIGVRPTFDLGDIPFCEVYIFDFDRDIYGKQLDVELLHMLRPEEKFKDIDELKEAINMDIINAKAYLQNKGLQ